MLLMGEVMSEMGNSVPSFRRFTSSPFQPPCSVCWKTLLGKAWRIPGRIEQIGRPPHDFLGRVAVGLQEGLVGKGEAVLLIRNADQLLSALHRVGQEPDLLLGPLAFGNVH